MEIRLAALIYNILFKYPFCVWQNAISQEQFCGRLFNEF